MKKLQFNLYLTDHLCIKAVTQQYRSMTFDVLLLVTLGALVFRPTTLLFWFTPTTLSNYLIKIISDKPTLNYLQQSKH